MSTGDQDDILSGNIWFSWSNTFWNGDMVSMRQSLNECSSRDFRAWWQPTDRTTALPRGDFTWSVKNLTFIRLSQKVTKTTKRSIDDRNVKTKKGIPFLINSRHQVPRYSLANCLPEVFQILALSSISAEACCGLSAGWNACASVMSSCRQENQWCAILFRSSMFLQTIMWSFFYIGYVVFVFVVV